MNTIKIFLATSGRVATLDKDFPLYQGSYQNKLLNVYVPTSILAPVFTSSTENYTAGTAVKIAMTYTTASGLIKYSVNREMRFLKTLTYQNVEYALYERMLPQEFTLYAGQGANAPTLIVNVVNIETDTPIPTVLSVITSQTCRLDVMQSSSLDNDEAIEPSELDTLNASINALNASMLLKQDKTDEALETTDKTVVGAINDLNTQTNANTTQIAENTTNIAQNTQDITDLRQSALTGITFVGYYPTQTTIPTDSQLNAFTETKLGRPPQNGDFIKFVLQDTTKADVNYNIYYSTGTWTPVQDVPIERASNVAFGTIKGSPDSISGTVFPNVVDGTITDITTKNNLGTKVNIATRLNSLDTLQQNIVSGTQVVGKATKAVQDQNGNVINTTYGVASNYYTKTESNSRYLPSTYTNVYYYAEGGFVDTIPTQTTPQWTLEKHDVGEATMFEITKTLENVYNFTKNSTDVSQLWVTADRDCTLSFKLTTRAKHATDLSYEILAVDLSGDIALEANTPTLLTYNTIYSSLENNELKLEIGDLFQKEFVVISTFSTATTISIYSNTTYPSTFNLSAQSIIFDVNTISGKKAVSILSTDWTDNGDGTYSTTVLQSKHQQPPTTDYGLDLQYSASATSVQRLAFTPTIDTSGNITITAYTPIDCTLLIWTANTGDTRKVLEYSNPTSLVKVDYNVYGAIKITQTVAPTNLNIPNPLNTAQYVTVVVANSTRSTNDIVINNNTISKGKGLTFGWAGQWVVTEANSLTSEIYDDYNNQTLNGWSVKKYGNGEIIATTELDYSETTDYTWNEQGIAYVQETLPTSLFGVVHSCECKAIDISSGTANKNSMIVAVKEFFSTTATDKVALMPMEYAWALNGYGLPTKLHILWTVRGE